MDSGPPISVAAVSAESPWSPGFRVRVEGPRPALERLGVSVTPMTLLSPAESGEFDRAGVPRKVALAARGRRRLRGRLRDGDGFDVALVHRRADLLPLTGLESLAARGRRLVYDVDDAIWLDSQPSSGTHRLAVLKGSRRKARLMAERAEHVVAGNAILAEHLAPFASSISVIPSLVDPATIARRQHADASRLVLGWIGSASTAGFLADIAPALRRVAAALPEVDLRLMTVGGHTPPVPGVELESRAWSEAAQQDALARMDVGLMPLPDTEWNRGKCAYKALLYMAAGVPVVTDDVGIARQVVGDGEAGHAVRGEDAWVEATVALLRERALRERLGEAGRRRVERDYSVERWAPELARVLRG